MKIITANKLNRFWQKGISPIVKLLGKNDISGIGDGTVTGAISSLNTDLTPNIVTSSGVDTLNAIANDLKNNWGSIKGRKMISYSNGANLYYGLVSKYSDTVGTVLLLSASDGAVKIYDRATNKISLFSPPVSRDIKGSPITIAGSTTELKTLRVPYSHVYAYTFYCTDNYIVPHFLSWTNVTDAGGNIVAHDVNFALHNLYTNARTASTYGVIVLTSE